MAEDERKNSLEGGNAQGEPGGSQEASGTKGFSSLTSRRHYWSREGRIESKQTGGENSPPQWILCGLGRPEIPWFSLVSLGFPWFSLVFLGFPWFPLVSLSSPWLPRGYLVATSWLHRGYIVATSWLHRLP